MIPIAMLSWLAVHLETEFIQRDLETRSAAALRGAGFDWASVVFSGRDGLLVGQANAPQREGAVARVRSVWGVRTVEARVAVSPAVDLPVAATAEDIAPAGAIDDIAPPMLDGRSVDEPSLALAPGDYAPATTVQARDYVEPVPQPIEAARVTSSAEGPALVAETPPPVAEQMPVVAEAPAPAATFDSAVALPGQMTALAGPVAPAFPAEQMPPALPPGPQTAAIEPPLPEHKPATPTPRVVMADPTPAIPEHKPAPPHADAVQTAAAAPPAPPLPERAPRFETAALPAGNISADGDCLSGVRAAAQQVEVHFGHGRAGLDTAGKALIDRLIGALNICPEAKISVSGHTDASGRARRNLALSKRRARGVASYMIQKGIDAGRLNAIGYGDKRPVAPNDTRANMARNRRIEVAVTARTAPLPPMPVRKQGTLDGLSRR
jgi:OOP family OmpA-OmpF porin